ncbi:MAG: hypothetical protein NZM26_04255, partial [Patescibacteria group bacterium]|nr:hypothetical protein [Patescibacteria group bacterium]
MTDKEPVQNQDLSKKEKEKNKGDFFAKLKQRLGLPDQVKTSDILYSTSGLTTVAGIADSALKALQEQQSSSSETGS